MQFFYAGTSFLIRIRIRGSDLRIRILLRILLFSSMTFKMPTKNNILNFFPSFFLRYIYIILQREKVIKKEVTSEDPDPEAQKT